MSLVDCISEKNNNNLKENNVFKRKNGVSHHDMTHLLQSETKDPKWRVSFKGHWGFQRQSDCSLIKGFLVSLLDGFHFWDPLTWQSIPRPYPIFLQPFYLGLLSYLLCHICNSHPSAKKQRSFQYKVPSLSLDFMSDGPSRKIGTRQEIGTYASGTIPNNLGSISLRSNSFRQNMGLFQ